VTGDVAVLIDFLDYQQTPCPAKANDATLFDTLAAPNDMRHVSARSSRASCGETGHRAVQAGGSPDRENCLAPHHKWCGFMTAAGLACGFCVLFLMTILNSKVGAGITSISLAEAVPCPAPYENHPSFQIRQP
jgi:hypothetical protein